MNHFPPLVKTWAWMMTNDNSPKVQKKEPCNTFGLGAIFSTELFTLITQALLSYC